MAAGSETANAETDTRDVADQVGNSQTAGPIGGNKVDKKAPQFTCEAAPSAWSANDVTRDCVAADGAFATALIVAGGLVGDERPALAVLEIAVGIAAATAFALVEPATTRAAFRTTDGPVDSSRA